MRPEDVKPGLRLWLRYIHQGLKTILVEVTEVKDGWVRARGPNGGGVHMPLMKFACEHAGRVVGEDLYETTEVALSGAWDSQRVGNRLKEAVRRAYLQARHPHVRSVSIGRTMRCGLKRVVASLVGFNGRVWMGPCGHGALGSLKWRGEIPPEGCGVVEITGRFEPTPPDYVI